MTLPGHERQHSGVDTPVIIVGQCSQRQSAAAGEYRSVHERGLASEKFREATHHASRARVQRAKMEQVLGFGRRTGQVAGAAGGSIPELGDHVAAEPGFGSFLVQHAGISAVRNMPAIEIADALAKTELDRIAVREHMRLAVGHVAEQHPIGRFDELAPWAWKAQY